MYYNYLIFDQNNQVVHDRVSLLVVDHNNRICSYSLYENGQWYTKQSLFDGRHHIVHLYVLFAYHGLKVFAIRLYQCIMGRSKYRNSVYFWYLLFQGQNVITRNLFCPMHCRGYHRAKFLRKRQIIMSFLLVSRIFPKQFSHD